MHKLCEYVFQLFHSELLFPKATSPSMAQLELSQENIVESEDTGLLTIPLSRTGNLVIASVVK